MGNFIRRTINSGKYDSNTTAVYHEYLFCYCRNNLNVKLNRRLKSEDERKKLYPLTDEHINTRGRYYISQLDKSSIQYSDSLNYPITAPDGSEIWPGNGIDDKRTVFRWSKQKVEWGLKNDFIVFKKQQKGWKVYAKSYEFRDNNNREILPSNPYTSLDYTDKKFSNFNATPELKKVLGNNLFNFPKPVPFIEDILKYSTNKDSLILDFFSGSATTAHAVMQLNAEDGGHRKYIMVQLPELTEEKSAAYKAGYKNICEIGKERIRRAGEMISAAHPEQKIDTGFRVLKLDSGNMEGWDKQRHPQRTLFDEVNNVKADRGDEDLLFQTMLRIGMPLSAPITTEEYAGKTCYKVDGNYLVACFAPDIDEEMIKEIAKSRPYYFVMRDHSAITDNVIDNFDQIFAKYSPETLTKIL